MAINRLWNRRYGPGGGTRRLHHRKLSTLLWGRNRIDVRNKDMRFARHGTIVIGLNFIRGNNNVSSNGGRKPANRQLRQPANGRRAVRKAA